MYPLRIVKRASKLGQAELMKVQEARRARRHPDALFVWIPKTAGTSVYEMLRACDFAKQKSIGHISRFFTSEGRVTFGHISVPMLVDAGLVTPQFVANAFKFTVVRNPYDRAVSLYNYFRKMELFATWRKEPTFSDFLHIIQSEFIDRVGLYNEKGLSQCNPQCDWLRGIVVDRIFKVETLAQEVDELSERFAKPDLKLGHSNRSSGLSFNALTADERNIIEAIYKEDFEMFGYG